MCFQSGSMDHQNFCHLRLIPIRKEDDVDSVAHFFPVHILPIPRKFPVQAVLERVVPQFPHEFPRRVIDLDRAIPRRREAHPHKNRWLIDIGTVDVPGHEEPIRWQWRIRRCQCRRLRHRRRGRNGERGGILRSPGIRRRVSRRPRPSGRRRQRRRRSIGRRDGPGICELGRFGVRGRFRPGKCKGGRRRPRHRRRKGLGR
jgi:hypothetical protein